MKLTNGNRAQAQVDKQRSGTTPVSSSMNAIPVKPIAVVIPLRTPTPPIVAPVVTASPTIAYTPLAEFTALLARLAAFNEKMPSNHQI
jgi:hypothetical protein